MMRIVIFILLALSPTTAFAQITLYNETLGNFPGDQGWLQYLANTFTNATQTYVPGQGTELVTTNGVSAGYFNKNYFTGSYINSAFPTLDRNIGFRISWDLLIHSETHSNPNRAGFSVIALSNDKLGIELGFWSNEIWAQSGSDFQHAEGMTFTTTNQTHYDLTLQGTSYALFANGVSVLTGALRDYSSFGVPYSYNNFLFLGDDTSLNDADITLGRVSLISAIPEPATWISLGCVAIVLVTLVARAWRRRVESELMIQASEQA
ncbi:MAG TPA: hypothetical protein PLN21_05800 [Gemmatales bacterium]|nr:hypothetical protein [Gemmatales bacterium]